MEEHDGVSGADGGLHTYLNTSKKSQCSSKIRGAAKNKEEEHFSIYLRLPGLPLPPDALSVVRVNLLPPPSPFFTSRLV